MAADDARAQALWLAACQHGDAAGCERLMERTAADSGLADDYGRLACELGSASACNMAGQSAFLHWRVSQEAPRLERAVRLFSRGCDFEDWSACWMGAVASTSSKRPDAAGPMGTRAAELAARACASTDALACESLAAHAHASGDQANAGRLFAQACAIELAGQALGARQEAMVKLLSCQRARELASEIPRTVAVSAETARWMSAEQLNARRIAGESELTPSDPVRLQMKRRRQSRIFARLQIELTELGLVRQVRILESSQYAAYDRYLFDSMRAWRYRPHHFDGKPRAVFTRVTFIYNQRN
ncbi:MAG TPA: TonB family protein [Kofleriaceae bacterium]|nr:TonB family protein [Kofleriaceae bacterium]